MQKLFIANIYYFKHIFLEGEKEWVKTKGEDEAEGVEMLLKKVKLTNQRISIFPVLKRVDNNLAYTSLSLKFSKSYK